MHRIGLIALAIGPLAGWTQNLEVNPSFEEYTSGPTYLSRIGSVIGSAVNGTINNMSGQFHANNGQYATGVEAVAAGASGFNIGTKSNASYGDVAYGISASALVRTCPLVHGRKTPSHRKLNGKDGLLNFRGMIPNSRGVPIFGSMLGKRRHNTSFKSPASMRLSAFNYPLPAPATKYQLPSTKYQLA